MMCVHRGPLVQDGMHVHRVALMGLRCDDSCDLT